MLLTIDEYRFHPHALERILDMNVSGEEVRNCLVSGEFYTDRKDPDRRIIHNGHIACVVTSDNLVLTVLWRHQGDWKRDFMEHGSYGGRAYRGGRPNLASLITGKNQ